MHSAGRAAAHTLLATVLAAILAACGSVPPAAVPTAPTIRLKVELPPPRVSYQQLEGLMIAAPRPMTGYSRARFPHWSEQPGGCSTREVVLERDGADVTVGDDCTPISGRWFSPYDRVTIQLASDVDVDHVVPLANASRSGADRWPEPRRKAFANDLEHPELLAVSRASNRAKGDQAPDQWRPPNRAFWCPYARAWIDVKFTWKLTVTLTEHQALAQLLHTCAAGGRR